MRLFVALLLSNDMKNALLEIQRQLKEQCVSLSLTQPQNLHLTLAFIGETERLSAASKAVDAAAGTPFDIALQGAGHFGNLWWVGLKKSPFLQSCGERVQAELRKRGFEIEDRAFRAHITFARKTVCNQPIRLTVPEAGMRVQRISLMESCRDAGRLVYTERYGRNL